MRSVNKATLIGNLGTVPEMRATSSGTQVCNFSLATNESWGGKDGGERQERVEWHKIVAWGRLAEICGEYLKKGSQVYIEGRIQTREWTDKEGQKRYTTEIVAQDMMMLGGRESGSSEPRRSPTPAAPKPAPTDDAGDYFDDDNDLPF